MPTKATMKLMHKYGIKLVWLLEPPVFETIFEFIDVLVLDKAVTYKLDPAASFAKFPDGVVDPPGALFAAKLCLCEGN